MIVFLTKSKVENYVQYRYLTLENLGLCRFILVGLLTHPPHSAVVSVILIKLRWAQLNR